jgi:hypothetical protein
MQALPRSDARPHERIGAEPSVMMEAVFGRYAICNFYARTGRF